MTYYSHRIRSTVLLIRSQFFCQSVIVKKHLDRFSSQNDSVRFETRCYPKDGKWWKKMVCISLNKSVEICKNSIWISLKNTPNVSYDLTIINSVNVEVTTAWWLSVYHPQSSDDRFRQDTDSHHTVLTSTVDSFFTFIYGSNYCLKIA